MECSAGIEDLDRGLLEDWRGLEMCVERRQGAGEMLLDHVLGTCRQRRVKTTVHLLFLSRIIQQLGLRTARMR